MDTSTLLAYEGYLNFLKFVGIFPYKIAFERESQEDMTSSFLWPGQARDFNFEKNKKLAGVDFHRRGVYMLTHYLNFGFFFTYGIFELWQFVFRAWNGAGAIELFGLSCWLWKPMFVAAGIIHFHWRMDSIANFHTNWHSVESSIYTSDYFKLYNI